MDYDSEHKADDSYNGWGLDSEQTGGKESEHCNVNCKNVCILSFLTTTTTPSPTCFAHQSHKITSAGEVTRSKLFGMRGVGGLAQGFIYMETQWELGGFLYTWSTITVISEQTRKGYFRERKKQSLKKKDSYIKVKYKATISKEKNTP